MPDSFAYDEWPSGEPYDWLGCDRSGPYDRVDFHVDLGCGRLKKGRIGIDRFPDPGVNVVMDLDPVDRRPVLPFDDSTIESIISHHCLEHVGYSFIPLVDEVYRVLKPGGLFRAIVPLFPSRPAVEDADHKRYFMTDTWKAFCGDPENHWHEGFATPYTAARFRMLDETWTPLADGDVWEQFREIRVAMEAVK